MPAAGGAARSRSTSGPGGRGCAQIESPDEMARDVFESDEELEEFLAFIADDRRADLA
jgi:hypothetical protein